jgi:hypothetical protein
MNYLYYRDGYYYYNRRVPLDLRHIDSRPYIRLALKTDSKRDALELLGTINNNVEDYWVVLINASQTHNQLLWKEYIWDKRLARFTLNRQPHQRPTPFTVQLDISRTRQSDPSSNPVRLSECLEKYWRFEKPKTFNKSANQIRKWKNPRKLALNNLIDCLGDKVLVDLTREDMLVFRVVDGSRHQRRSDRYNSE